MSFSVQLDQIKIVRYTFSDRDLDFCFMKQKRKQEHNRWKKRQKVAWK